MTGAPAPGDHSEWVSSLREAVPEATRRLGLAVSGGGDSMALLQLACEALGDTGVTLHVVTVDHGLRPEAADEIALVAQASDARGLSHDVLNWDGTGCSGNLQDAARRARYDLIAAWAGSKGVDAVALGHTRDDQAETFLMRLGRSPGIDGLSEMDRRFSRHGVVWVRPLLDRGREELRNYLTSCGVDWADDPSNDDERFLRVRARKALETLGPLGIDAGALSHTAQHLAEQRDALDHFVRALVLKHAELEGGDLIVRQYADIKPTSCRRRILAAGLRWIGQTDYPPRATAVTETDAKIRRGDRHTINGCLVTPTGRDVRIGRELNSVKALRAAPNTVWDGRWKVLGEAGKGFEIRPLSEGIATLPDWRDVGLPRDTLMASPAVWDGAALISAPLAGFSGGFTIQSPKLQDFLSHAFAH